MSNEKRNKRKAAGKQGKEKNNAPRAPITREQIIKSLIETEFVPKYIATLAHPTDAEFLNDLEQDIYCILCTLPEEKLTAIYNGNVNNLRRYVSGIIHRQIKSTTSAYYRTYKRPNNRIDRNDRPLAEKEELGVFCSEWYDLIEESDFSNKIKL